MTLLGRVQAWQLAPEASNSGFADESGAFLPKPLKSANHVQALLDPKFLSITQTQTGRDEMADSSRTLDSHTSRF